MSTTAPAGSPVPQGEPEVEPGRVLDGRFTIRGLLGEGGLGTVYRAHDEKRGREVALKILVPRYRGRAEREQRLIDEARHAQKIGEHESLVTTLDWCRIADLGNCPAVVSEIVSGQSLNAILALRGPMPPRTAMLCARKLAEAVRAIHIAGVVHRDVTVENVFIEDLESDPKITLIDLSHAARFGDAVKRNTTDLEVPGTPRYMSPEQAQAQAADPKMDVYGFGIVLHEMLTGKNPFEHVGDAATFVQSQAAGALEPARIDLRSHPQVPQSLIDLVSACTRPSPLERPDMDGVISALGEAQAVLHLSRRREGTSILPVQGIDVAAMAAQEDAQGGVLGLAERASRRAREARAAQSAASLSRSDLAASQGPALWKVVMVAVLLLSGIAAGLAVWRFSASHDEATSAGEVAMVAEPNKEDRDTPKPSELDPTPAVSPTEPTPEADPVVADPPDADAGKDPPESPPDASASDASSASDDGKAAAVPDAKMLDAKVPDAKVPAPKPTTTKPKGLDPSSPECKEIVADANAAKRDRKWSQVITLTAKAACWSDKSSLLVLRCNALLQEGRYEQCAKSCAASSDPEVRRFAGLCAEKATP
jgi:tRNA A-37 threonylcarbamoyl transferase component Bud32